MRSGFQKNGNGFYCGFSSSGAPVQQLLPVFTKTELGHQGKTSCFILAALLFKDLEHSLSHLIAARSPSSCFLPSLPSSPQVLSNFSPGEKWSGVVCGSMLRCVFSAFVHVHVFLRVCTLVSTESCVYMCFSDSVCALFKPTVSKGLQDSLCIIGDLLLSAHCIWQIWIGDCHEDMLINDIHNWYLLIARDEKTGIAERKRDKMMNTHTL